ncbi:MAG: DUF7619 domain-containing protein [Bacteroidia bacterium]
MKKRLLSSLLFVLIGCSSLLQAQVSITSFWSNIPTQNCNPSSNATFHINGLASNYTQNDSLTLTIDFGDLSNDTLRFPLQMAGPNGYYNLMPALVHPYTNFGLYTIVAIVTGPNGAADTATTYFMNSSVCNNIYGSMFVDLDGSCNLSSGDVAVINSPLYLQYNGIKVLRSTSDVQGNYSLSAEPGYTYELFAGDTSTSSQDAEIVLSCTSSQGMSLTPAPSVFQDLIVYDTTTVSITQAYSTGPSNQPNCIPYNRNFVIIGKTFGYVSAGIDSIDVYLNFGDGSDTTARVYMPPQSPSVSPFNLFVSHVYTASGQYNTFYKATGLDGTTDSVIRYNDVVVYDTCGNVQGITYVDNNSNCIYDSGDFIVPNVQVTLSQNNTLVASTMSDLNGHYSMTSAIGNYTLALNPIALSNLGYQASCPLSGSSNISLIANTTTQADFGITCVTTFDLFAGFIPLSGMITPTTTALVKPSIANNSCVPTSGIIHVVLDPKVFFVSNSNNSLTYTFSGDTISWPFAGLTNTNSYLVNWQNYIQVQGIPSLLPTDTVCFEVFVTPTVGDINPLNNFRTRCDPAYTSYDPNAKYVSPEGIGATGIIPADTALTYTVQFQNTGTFAARDIYILDTLDADLDLATLVILGSSHPMDVQILPGNVLRFNFPLIWLPDSNSNEPASHGWLQYYIDQKPNLAPGTVIENTAAIYFDFNAPVITNTTINTLENPAAIEQLVSENGVAVFPNPASDELNLVLDKSFTGTIMLTDALGRVVQTQRINVSTTAKLMLENLPAGVYSLVIQDGEKQVVKKIVVAR